MTSSEIEDFPSCVGCRYFVNNECIDEPKNLMDCYRGGDDFTSSKFDKWVVKFRDLT